MDTQEPARVADEDDDREPTAEEIAAQQEAYVGYLCREMSESLGLLKPAREDHQRIVASLRVLLDGIVKDLDLPPDPFSDEDTEYHFDNDTRHPPERRLYNALHALQFAFDRKVENLAFPQGSDSKDRLELVKKTIQLFEKQNEDRGRRIDKLDVLIDELKHECIARQVMRSAAVNESLKRHGHACLVCMPDPCDMDQLHLQRSRLSYARQPLAQADIAEMTREGLEGEVQRLRAMLPVCLVHPGAPPWVQEAHEWLTGWDFAAGSKRNPSFSWRDNAGEFAGRRRIHRSVSDEDWTATRLSTLGEETCKVTPSLDEALFFLGVRRLGNNSPVPCARTPIGGQAWRARRRQRATG